MAPVQLPGSSLAIAAISGENQHMEELNLCFSFSLGKSDF